MNETDILQAFEAGCLNPEVVDHQTHIWLTWQYLRKLSVPETMVVMSRGLRRLAAHAGRADRYHETLSCAWVAIIAARKMQMNSEAPFKAFRQEHPDLFEQKNRCVQAFYRSETLTSDMARKHFLWPDAVALP